jgi:hypothetical protein
MTKMTMQQIAELRYWTKAIRDGKAELSWIDRGTRVSWTEVVARAETMGVTLHPTDQEFLQRMFES